MHTFTNSSNSPTHLTSIRTNTFQIIADLIQESVMDHQDEIANYLLQNSYIIFAFVLLLKIVFTTHEYIFNLSSIQENQE